MNNRLTWQQVAAPDFSDAILARDAAARGFARAMDSVVGTIGSIDARKRNDASAIAMEKMLQYQDVGGWDQAMKGGVFGALGIRPDQATPELMNMVTGRRDVLEGDRTTDFNNYTSNYYQGRTEQSDQRSDKERAWNEAGYAAANEAVKLGLTPEETLRAIRDNPNLSPEVRDAAMKHFQSGMDPNMFLIGKDTTFSNPEAAEAHTALTDYVGTEKARINDLLWKNPDAAVIVKADAMAPGSDPTAALIDQIDSTVNKDGDNEWSKGEVRDLVLRLKSDFPDVPENVIAAALGTFIDGAGWTAWSNDQTSIDVSEVRNFLGRISQPGAIGELRKVTKGIQDEQAKVDQIEARVAELKNRILIAEERGVSADEYYAELLQLQEGLVSASSSSAGGGDPGGGGKAPLSQEEISKLTTLIDGLVAAGQGGTPPAAPQGQPTPPTMYDDPSMGFINPAVLPPPAAARPTNQSFPLDGFYLGDALPSFPANATPNPDDIIMNWGAGLARNLEEARKKNDGKKADTKAKGKKGKDPDAPYGWKYVMRNGRRVRVPKMQWE